MLQTDIAFNKRAIFHWRPPIGDLILGEEQVHLWYVSLDTAAADLNQPEKILSIEELARAGQFHFDKDRVRFSVCRAILRILLGGYSGVDPIKLEVRLGKAGKPYLADQRCRDPITFNLSCSEGYVLLAFARKRGIGVDLESIHDVPEIEQLVANFFSVREADAFRTLPQECRRSAFFRCWTAKEAFLKGLGDGLSRGLDRFDVDFAPTAGVHLRSVQWDPSVVSRWSLESISLSPQFAAALAVEKTAAG